jgi:nitrogen regulatory protein P-II 1
LKKIVALVRPHKLDEVKLALVNIGVIGLTISEVRQFGWQKGQETTYRGNVTVMDLIPRIKLEIVVDDAQVLEIVQALTRSASTGEVGDGKIFITPVGETIRIRTGETNAEAL